MPRLFDEGKSSYELGSNSNRLDSDGERGENYNQKNAEQGPTDESHNDQTVTMSLAGSISLGKIKLSS